MESNENLLGLESEIIKVLSNIHDPEIPVDIYSLGLIYEVNVDDNNNVEIVMTLTAPNCPVADNLVEEVRAGVAAIKGVKSSKVVPRPPVVIKTSGFRSNASRITCTISSSLSPIVVMRNSFPARVISLFPSQLALVFTVLPMRSSFPKQINSAVNIVFFKPS